MLVYALYARKSDERKEVTEKSISEQVAENRQVALAHGLHIGVVIEESMSAKTPGVRPLYSNLIKKIERGQITGILTWKINRLVRNMKEGGELAQLLIDGKIKEIRTPHQVFKQGENILSLVLEAATSTQYSLDLHDSVTRGMNGHFEMGGWNSKAHVGYVNARHPVNQKIGVVVPDGDRFTMLRLGWDMMLTGAYTPEQVADYLNDTLGFRTRRTVKRGGTPLSRSCAYRLFQNPFYAGYIRYKGELRRGNHETMVTEGEFQQVQQLLRDRARPTQHAHHRTFAYTGLMKCGYCGQQITAEAHTLRSGSPYVFYRCSDSYRRCTMKGVSETVVEGVILGLLTSLQIEPALCDAAHANVDRWLDGEALRTAAAYLEQNQALADVETQLANLLEMWLRGLMTDEAEYKQTRGKLLARKETLTLKDATDRNEIEQMRATSANVRDYAKSIHEAFAIADPKRKRELAQALCTDYHLFGRERQLTATVHPLLQEFVSFARKQEAPRTSSPTLTPTVRPGSRTPKKPRFEPRISGSGGFIPHRFSSPVLVGRADDVELEPPEAYIDLLRSSSFPDLGLGPALPGL